jgi:aryl-alcohol dehydrogenase-like predicted oxidoreductase
MKYLNKEINGITLSRIGLGAMRMADVQGVDTIHAALDSGITYLTFMVTEKVNW